MIQLYLMEQKLSHVEIFVNMYVVVVLRNYEHWEKYDGFQKKELLKLQNVKFKLLYI